MQEVLYAPLMMAGTRKHQELALQYQNRALHRMEELFELLEAVQG